MIHIVVAFYDTVLLSTEYKRKNTAVLLLKHYGRYGVVPCVRARRVESVGTMPPCPTSTVLPGDVSAAVLVGPHQVCGVSCTCLHRCETGRRGVCMQAVLLTAAPRPIFTSHRVMMALLSPHRCCCLWFAGVRPLTWLSQQNCFTSR